MSEAISEDRLGSSAGHESRDIDEYADAALFEEPDGYFRSETPPSFAEHTILSSEKIRLRLVGHNPLWVRPS